MIHNDATIEDVIRMAYNTPTYTYGHKLAAGDALTRLHPDVLRAMHLPSQPTGSESARAGMAEWNWNAERSLRHRHLPAALDRHRA
jgi:hypothetical protein